MTISEGSAPETAAKPAAPRRQRDPAKVKKQIARSKTKSAPSVNAIVDRAVAIHGLAGDVRQALQSALAGGPKTVPLGDLAAASLGEIAPTMETLGQVIEMAVCADKLQIGFRAATWRDDKAKVAVAAKVVSSVTDNAVAPEPMAIAEAIAGLGEPQVAVLTHVRDFLTAT